MGDFNWLLPITGFIFGTLLGMTGMGGGVLVTPFLLAVGLPPVSAVGTDLVYSTITKIFGTWQHWRQGSVDRSVVFELALGSVPATIVAVAALAWLRQNDAELLNTSLKQAIGVALLIAALLMIYRLFIAPRMKSGDFVGRKRRVTLIAIGAIGGFMVGITSIGSGSLIIALLVLVIRLSPEKLVGTDIAHATILVSVAAAGHLAVGDVNLSVVAGLLIGSIPGILLGSRLTMVVPKKALQMGLAGLLLVTAVPLLR